MLVRSLQHRRTGECGSTLIEFLMAFFVIVVGMTGGLLLLVTAIATNGRSKRDTEATSLAQLVVEQMSAGSSQATDSSFVMRDCRSASAGGPREWRIETTGTPSGSGARLNPNTGEIDWLQPSDTLPRDYAAAYTSCGPDATVYDIRWNVRTLTSTTRLVTVSARPRTASFVPPVTLRTILGY